MVHGYTCVLPQDVNPISHKGVLTYINYTIIHSASADESAAKYLETSALLGVLGADIHQEQPSIRNMQVVSSNRVHSTHSCEANKCRIFKPFFFVYQIKGFQCLIEKKIEKDIYLARELNTHQIFLLNIFNLGLCNFAPIFLVNIKTYFSQLLRCALYA